MAIDQAGESLQQGLDRRGFGEHLASLPLWNAPQSLANHHAPILWTARAADPTSTALGTPTAQGLVGAVLDPGRFGAVLRALETVNEGRTLSMPRMLVNNNQEASLDSVLEAPYTSTNASDTVATTSFRGSSEAGTQINIKPQIAAGDRVVIDYSITLGGFTADSADANLPPPKKGTSM